MRITSVKPSPVFSCHNCHREEGAVELRLEWQQGVYWRLCPKCLDLLRELLAEWPSAASFIPTQDAR